jgi:hypothetical protein
MGLTGYERGQLAVLAVGGVLVFIGGVIAGHVGAMLVGLGGMAIGGGYFLYRVLRSRR